MTIAPVVHELRPVPRVDGALRACVDLPGVILFDSARHDSRLGRYSFLSGDPVEMFSLQEATVSRDPFAELRGLMASRVEATLPGLPPFQGGAAGVLSYELGHAWEKLPRTDIDEFQFPAFTIGLYDWVLAWDHLDDRCWIVARNRPNLSAQSRIDDLIERLQDNSGPPSAIDPVSAATSSDIVRPIQRDITALATRSFRANGPAELQSNFSQKSYVETVARVVDYIRAGDIFQANLSQRLMFPARESALETYLRLREVNPAPFGGFMAHDDWAVLSASPERFLQLEGNIVETRPIKGTRQRIRSSVVDLFTRDALRESTKDASENVMIVDLLRNDLSRVCRPGSISVPKLCELESYETVHHLVSEVRGELRAGLTFWEVLAATFPGGSITGAPKVRAMEIITELEQVSRGPYCGSLFYLGYDGRADSNILIRTFSRRQGWLQCSVGGGIIAQSDPESEYAETLHKAAGMIRALK